MGFVVTSSAVEVDIVVISVIGVVLINVPIVGVVTVTVEVEVISIVLAVLALEVTGINFVVAVTAVVVSIGIVVSIVELAVNCNVVLLGELIPAELDSTFSLTPTFLDVDIVVIGDDFSRVTEFEVLVELVECIFCVEFS